MNSLSKSIVVALLLTVIASTQVGAQSLLRGVPAGTEGPPGKPSTQIGTNAKLAELARPPTIESAVETAAARPDAKPEDHVRSLLRHYVRGTLRQNPQLLQSEADSRAAEYRIGESRGNLYPRVSVTGTVASEQQDRANLPNVGFEQRSGQLRVLMPVYDQVAMAQLAQRESASISADWRLTDVREQLMLRTLENYVELVRAERLATLAQENVRTHRLYVAQIKDIARFDTGRTADLYTAVARTSLAESILVSRVARLDSAKAQWRQLTGMSAPPQLPEAPRVTLPPTLESVLSSALADHPVIQLARADVEVARDGIAIARAPYRPRVTLEANTRFGNDWGGFVGNQTTRYIGVALEVPVFNGFSDQFADRAASEQVQAATHAQDRIRDELRRRVEQFWFDLQAAAASLRTFEDYARSAKDMVDATRNQFKIGRRTLLDLLNTENELFTARSNIESAEMDITLAGWRLLGVRGRIAAELDL